MSKRKNKLKLSLKNPLKLKKKNLVASNYKTIQHLKSFTESKKPIKIKINALATREYWRIKVIDFFYHLTKKNIKGKCLEIGAGKGLPTAYLSSFKNVKLIYCMDYSVFAVKKLMPTYQKLVEFVNLKKIKRVLGTYDKIKYKNLDFIFAFGALHNSPDLNQTFKSIYKSLKKNGFLIVSDMCLSIKSNKYDELKKTDRLNINSKKIFGKKISFRNSNDYFRSMMDFIYCAKQAGFSVYPFIFDQSGEKKIPKKLDDCFKGPGIEVFYPFFAKDKYDRLVLVCHKSNKCLDELDEGFGKNIKFGFFQKILIRLNFIFKINILSNKVF